MLTDQERLSILWNKFDYKGVVAFTGYKDRVASLTKELERVGMQGYHIHWDFPTPYKDVLGQVIPMTRFNRARRCFHIGFNNYKAIATAYYLGAKRCLIMEDDIRFLKDLRGVADTLESLPEDFDVAMLDSNKPCTMTEYEYLDIFKHKENEHWSRFENMRSTGCYAMSEKGMAAYLSAFERPLRGQGELRNPDAYLNKAYLGEDKKMYVANPPLAIQKVFPEMRSSCKTLLEYRNMRAKIFGDNGNLDCYEA